MKYNKIIAAFIFTGLLLLLSGSTEIVRPQDSTATDTLINNFLDEIEGKPDTLIVTGSDTIKVKDKQEKRPVENLKPPQISDIISIPKIIWSLIFVILGYFIIRLMISLISSLSIRYPRYDFTIKRIIPIFRILAWVVLIYIIVIGIFNPPAATLIAVFTSVGVAVGFAAQDLLKNVFGGLVVMFDRPFQIGDKIEAGKYYGEVVEIGIRSTKIVTPDDSMVTVPNSEFMIQYVSNSNSGENNCQVVAELYLPIDIDTEKVREIATQAAQVSKYIYLNKPVVVLFFNEIKDKRTVLKMRLKAYVSDLSKEFYFKSEMTEIVLKSLIEKEIIEKDFYRN
ncbi:MAG: mechanosensitive ion channel [Bacteroidales bacterium]|nr:mechanosensitive ion channel [Bacteroidales bacterium]